MRQKEFSRNRLLHVQVEVTNLQPVVRPQGQMSTNYNINNKTGNVVYGNIDARSRNHCYRGKALRITHFCVHARARARVCVCVCV
jgi:hypothetical protein